MLTPTLLQPLLTSVSRTLTRDAEDPEAAAALLEAFRPETPIQALLAAQAIALHHAAMDCFAGAMETPAEDRPAITRLHRNAASLTRAFAATLRALQRDQAQAAKQAEAAWQDPMQRETGWKSGAGEEDSSAAACGDPSTPPANRDPSTPPPILGPLRGPSPQGEGEFIQSPLPSSQDPMQTHAPGLRPGGEPAPGLQPGGEEPAQRPWELLTEAEQFAILYPERVAAGATSHEDAHLWLPRLTNPARAKARRAAEPHAT